MRRALLILSLLGFGGFAALLATSFLHPLLLERGARELVRIEVERRVGAKVEALSNSKVADLAGRVLSKVDADIVEAKRKLSEEVPRRVAAVVSGMLDANCACRKWMREAAVKGQEARIDSLTHMRERLVVLIETTYASVANSLLREVRIVSTANAVAFALLGLIAFTRRGAAIQLLVPAFVLTGAVALTAGMYVFYQNWLHTLVYSDYVGFGYVAYLAVVAGFLADVFLNRSRITTRLVNALLNLVGSVVQVVPC